MIDVNTDYYQVLGVSKTASDEEIKKVYRELAKKHHPDKHQGDSENEKRFQAISEAYDILGDKAKRAEYDQMRENPFMRNGGQGYGGGQYQQFDMDDLGDLFGSMFGGRGRGGGFSGGFQQSRRVEPTDVKLLIPFQLAVKGGDYLYMAPNGKRIKLKIPKGCAPGHQMKISGQGRQGEDLIIHVDLTMPENVRLEGDRLIQTIEIPVWDAINGGKIPVHLYNDKTVNLTVKPGSASHTRLKLGGMGLDGGDLFIELKLRTPSDLTDEQRQLIEQLKHTTRT